MELCIKTSIDDCTDHFQPFQLQIVHQLKARNLELHSTNMKEDPHTRYSFIIVQLKHYISHVKSLFGAHLPRLVEHPLAGT